jgi:hypothetical protein
MKGIFFVAAAALVSLLSSAPARANWTNPFPAGSCARSLASGWVIGCDPDANGNGHVYRWLPSDGWSRPDSVARGVFITVDLLGAPWITNSAGQIFKFGKGGFDAFQPQSSFCASRVAVGMEINNEVWAIRCNEAGVYHWNGAAWERIGGTLVAAQIAVFSQPDPVCGEHLPWTMGFAPDPHGPRPPFFQGVVQEACGSHNFTATPFRGNGLTTDFLLGTDNNLYHWNGTNLESPPYAVAPWGLQSVIANGTNGLFAANPGAANGIRVFQTP